ncbi:hypothetical protein LTR85_004628 [Meristemomyces frigidus]|nr:hypothetical protein LTR85_004628 [Meristemomyces frigidus]
MDPLSISTAVLTVFGAAVEVAKSLEHLRSVHKLPAEFTSLLAKVADLQYVLHPCDEFCKANKHLEKKIRETGLLSHGTSAKAKLEHLANSVAKHVTPNGLASPKELKAFWAGLVHGKSQLSRHRDELRDIRLGLAATLQVLTSPTILSVDGKLDAVLASQQDLFGRRGALDIAPSQNIVQHNTAIDISGTFALQAGPLTISKKKRQMTRRKTFRAPGNPLKPGSLVDVSIPEDRLGKFCKPCTGVGITWERVLSGQMSSDEGSVVASLFRDSDYLSTRAFTVTPKIVLGLVVADLDLELSLNTGSASLVAYLLGLGGEVNAADHSDQTALHAAKGNGRYMPFIDVRLDTGADVNARNNSGDTPLHFTGINNCGQSWAHAIARTADLETSGKTCIEYFEERMAFLDEGEGAELREAFGELVYALTGPPPPGKTSVVEESGGFIILQGAKCDMTVRVAELFEDPGEEIGLREVYHDALEMF